jgi:hypothetical protein
MIWNGIVDMGQVKSVHIILKMQWRDQSTIFHGVMVLIAPDLTLSYILIRALRWHAAAAAAGPLYPSLCTVARVIGRV